MPTTFDFPTFFAIGVAISILMLTLPILSRVIRKFRSRW